MIPCKLQLIDEYDERGWQGCTCPRCNRKPIFAPDPPEKRKGDPVWCKAWPWWHEFGYIFSIFLEAIFLDEPRWIWIKTQFGFQPKCGCQQRQDSLNRFGEWLRSAALSVWRRLRFANYLQKLRSKLTFNRYNQP